MSGGAASEYFETATGNRISRKSALYGTQNIRIHGKSLVENDVTIRGDLANVKMGKHCCIRDGVVLRPSMKIVKDKAVFFSLSLGNNVLIDSGSVVEASVIGSGVIIGKNCVIPRRCVLKDCCWIKDGTVLAPDTVVPPFSIFEGCPGRFVGELPESAPAMIASVVRAAYLASRDEASSPT